MTAQQQIILSLIKSDIKSESFVLPSECDWDAVLLEARQQSVLLAVFELLSKYEKEIPKAVYSKFFQTACAYLSNNAKVGHVQKELVEALSKNNIPYVILKGEAAASYYKKPEQRLLGDVDFLVPESALSAAGSVLEGLGYSRFDEDHVCHIVYKKPSAHCEMHFAFSGMPKGEKGKKVQEYISGIFDESVKKNIGGGEFFAPSDRYHALLLLLHTQHHITGEGIGLRHLCDWAYFVKNTEGAPFWEESLLPHLKEIGLLRFAKILSLMCSRHLGITCPDWAADADEETADELFCEILDGGNFGRKDGLRTSSEKMIANRGDGENQKGKLHNLYENLKCSVKEKHKSVQKIPILFPVFFLYRAARYFIFMLFGKRVMLHKSLKQAEERITLYDKLGIFKEEIKDGKL